MRIKLCIFKLDSQDTNKNASTIKSITKHFHLYYSFVFIFLQSCPIVVIAMLSLDNTKSTTTFSKHGPQVPSKKFWSLSCVEMSTGFIICLEDDRTQGPSPRLRIDA